jgi:hypothetical protein
MFSINIFHCPLNVPARRSVVPPNFSPRPAWSAAFACGPEFSSWPCGDHFMPGIWRTLMPMPMNSRTANSSRPAANSDTACPTSARLFPVAAAVSATVLSHCVEPTPNSRIARAASAISETLNGLPFAICRKREIS